MTTETIDGFFLSDDGIDNSSGDSVVAIVREHDDSYIALDTINDLMDYMKRDIAGFHALVDFIAVLGSAPLPPASSMN